MAIVVLGLALVAVIVTAPGEDDPTRKARPGKAARPDGAGGRPRGRRPTLADEAYAVRPGEPPTAMATRTGIGAARLQRLNPDVDPQALVSVRKLEPRE